MELSFANLQLFTRALPCETEVPCSFFSVRDERNLCSQPHDFLSCMRELRHEKRHFLFSRDAPRPLTWRKQFVASFLLESDSSNKEKAAI